MSDTTKTVAGRELTGPMQIDRFVPPQNDPNTNVRTLHTIQPGGIPPGICKSALLIISNATLGTAGTINIILSATCSIPVYLPTSPTNFQVNIGTLTDSEFIAIDEFTLSQPLVGGNITLLVTK